MVRGCVRILCSLLWVTNCIYLYINVFPVGCAAKKTVCHQMMFIVLYLFFQQHKLMAQNERDLRLYREKEEAFEVRKFQNAALCDRPWDTTG